MVSVNFMQSDNAATFKKGMTKLEGESRANLVMP